MSIKLESIQKRFGEYQALDDVNLEIREGEMLGLLGPSGSGKTTLLRVIAGLEVADSGRILFSGRDVTRLDARDRQVGFVFQQYALFRHMTVLDNVGFSLRILPRKQRPSQQDIQQQAMALLDKVQLADLAQRYPEQLSGGQRQRVALARALAMKPSVLLLDEPFGALDAKVRKELRRWLRKLHDEMNFTGIFVTHDQEEALELSDRVVVMNRGAIEQDAAPRELYRRPATRFVFDFLGDNNLFSGEVNEAGRLNQGEAWLQLGTRSITGRLCTYFRSHEMALSEKPTAFAHLPLQIESLSRVGAEVRLELQPVGWTSAQPWETRLSDAEWEALGMSRGAFCYAVPKLLHGFSGDDSRPLTFVLGQDEQTYLPE